MSEAPEDVDETLEEQSRTILASMDLWLPRLSALVLGPGLGRDRLMLLSTKRVIESARTHGIPLVLDGVKQREPNVSC